jgi:hypothetical protein
LLLLLSPYRLCLDPNRFFAAGAKTPPRTKNTAEDKSDRPSLSPITVRRHASSMMRKLGVSSREEAVAFVAEHGIHTRRRVA